MQFLLQLPAGFRDLAEKQPWSAAFQAIVLCVSFSQTWPRYDPRPAHTAVIVPQGCAAKGFACAGMIFPGRIPTIGMRSHAS